MGMAYVGTTGGATSANPPIMIARGLGGVNQSSTTIQGRGVWLYNSSDSSTLWQGANYFTDAYYLGMKQNDVLIGVWQSSVGASAIMVIGAISSVTTNGANLTTGGAITSTFN